MKKISIVTPCYNEEDNVMALYVAVKDVMSDHGEYRYEHIFIDNGSEDKTRIILREMASADKNIKVIFNTRNFGHIRSPMYAYFQATGDAIISLACDFQDPVEMIHQFILAWEAGSKIVIGARAGTSESKVMSSIRSLYYWLVTKTSHIKLIKNFTGFGLYDRVVIEAVRDMDDRYPYFRGAICEMGFAIKEIPYFQPKRKSGVTKNNFYTLFDLAMLGLTTHSKVLIRIMTVFGFLLSVLSLLGVVVVLIFKLLFWKYFSVGIAPIMMILLFFFSVILFFMGVLGEYVGNIYTQVMKRPLVYVQERINFDDENNNE